MESLKKNSKILFNKYKDKIIDIVLFGSYAKGKIKPEDIDICIILKNKDDFAENLYSEFRDLFGEDAHYNWLSVSSLFEESLTSTLLEEGFSLIKDKPLHESLGYSSSYIFSFNLRNLSNGRKVLFSYALHGKNKEGILSKLKGRVFGKAVVIIPIVHSEEFREFLETWEVQYESRRVLMKE